jgi:hypothetical protein
MASCFANLQQLVHQSPVQNWHRWVFPGSGAIPTTAVNPVQSQVVNPPLHNSVANSGFPSNLPSPPFTFPTFQTTSNLFPPPQSFLNLSPQPGSNPFNAQASSNLFSSSEPNPFLVGTSTGQPSPPFHFLIPPLQTGSNPFNSIPTGSNPFPPTPFIFSPLETPLPPSCSSPQPTPNPFPSPPSNSNPFDTSKPEPRDIPETKSDPWGINMFQNWFKNVLPNYISSDHFLAEKYQDELKLLAEMGWKDRRICLKALQQCNGDVMTAVELLLANQTSDLILL